MKYYVTDKVIQDLGSSFLVVHGGTSPQSGRRSRIETCSIIMIDGINPSAAYPGRPPLTSRGLFIGTCVHTAVGGFRRRR